MIHYQLPPNFKVKTIPDIMDTNPPHPVRTAFTF